MNKLKELQGRLENLGCLASIDQIRRYLDASGKTPTDLDQMTDDQVRQWFSHCLDSLYAHRPS